MLGYGEDEIRGDLAEWEGRLHPEDRQRAMATLRDYLEGRSSDYELEHRVRHKDGTYRWILARGAAVRDAEGAPYRMVGSHLDITAHKLAEARAREHDSQFLVAQRIQEHLLPRRSPVVAGFDIAGMSYPAEFTGGDSFDYLAMRGGFLGLAIGDVAGHGFAPALLMASTHAYLRSLARTSDDVGEILAICNAILIEETEGDRFVTLLLGRLDPATRSFLYCNAGHPTGYVLDAAGNVKSSLESTAAPLGLLTQEQFVSAGPVLLEPGDLLLLITDGVLEAISPEEEPFGIERMLQVVRKHRHQTSREIIEQLYQAVIGFSQTEKPLDDVTAVVVKVGAGFAG
jgi:PAS domain S-box-containing protein